jgi:hypothetical protein
LPGEVNQWMCGLWIEKKVPYMLREKEKIDPGELIAGTFYFLCALGSVCIIILLIDRIW